MNEVLSEFLVKPDYLTYEDSEQGDEAYARDLHNYIEELVKCLRGCGDVIDTVLLVLNTIDDQRRNQTQVLRETAALRNLLVPHRERINQSIT